MNAMARGEALMKGMLCALMLFAQPRRGRRAYRRRNDSFSPEAGAAALVEALKANDTASLRDIVRPALAWI